MSPAEIIYAEECRKGADEHLRREREATLHRWVAEGSVVYNAHRCWYEVGCTAHRVIFNVLDHDTPFPSERFIADLALAISSLGCLPSSAAALRDEVRNLGGTLR